MFGEDTPLHSLSLHILLRQIATKSKKENKYSTKIKKLALLFCDVSGFVFSYVMVSQDDLTLECCHVDCSFISVRMSSVYDCVSCLSVELIQLNGIIAVHILIRKEELFPTQRKSENQYELINLKDASKGGT